MSEDLLSGDVSHFDMCKTCGEKVTYNRTNCSKGHLVGFPNVRRAQKMKAALDAHYAQARENAAGRDVLPEFERLQTLLSQAVPTLNLALRVADNLACGQPYVAYYEAVDDDQKEIAESGFHADRSKVDDAIHSGYKKKIVNLALSPDGRSLPNYGEVALVLKTVSVAQRASLLRENAFDFYRRFDLGGIGVREQPGWRAIWDDRALLGAAALEPRLEQGMSDDDIRRLILTAMPTRQEDRFIELHLFTAVVCEFVDEFYLAASITGSSEETIWANIRHNLPGYGAKLSDVRDV